MPLRFQPTSFLTLRGTASTGFRRRRFTICIRAFLAASSAGTMGDIQPVLPAGQLQCRVDSDRLRSHRASACTAEAATSTPEASQNFDFGVIVSPIEDLDITLDYSRVLLGNRVDRSGLGHLP